MKLFTNTAVGIEPIEVVMDVVSADKTAFLGFDVINRKRIMAYTVLNRFIKRICVADLETLTDASSIPMCRSSGRRLNAKIHFPVHLLFPRS